MGYLIGGDRFIKQADLIADRAIGRPQRLFYITKQSSFLSIADLIGRGTENRNGSLLGGL